MKHLILAIALVLCSVYGTADAQQYVVQQPHQVYVVQPQPANLVLVYNTQYYVVTVPMTHTVYWQQWYYWQQPYRLCRW